MSNEVITGELSKKRMKSFVWKIPKFSSLRQTGADFYDSLSFNFMNASFRLRIWPPSLAYNVLSVSLVKNPTAMYVSDFYGTSTFSIRKSDYSLLKFRKGTCNSNTLEGSLLRERQFELLPSDTLTIICDLECSSVKQILPPAEKIHTRLTDLDALSESFKTLLSNTESCDTTLLVMEKEYKAHRTVLMARSSVFAAMFLHETSEKQTGIVNITDCEPETFKEFLEYLYTGKLDKPSPSSAIHLYQTSDKYDVQKLKSFCSGFIVENITAELLCDVVIMADKYKDAKMLSAAQNFFNKNMRKVFVTSEWNDLLNSNRHLANKLLMEMSLKTEAN